MTYLRSCLLAGALALGMIPAESATFAVKHHFTGADGANPSGRLIMDAEGRIFGTTYTGGASNMGTLFKFDGVNLTTLVTFKGTNGATPWGSLLADTDGNLYGTTTGGGAHGYGTVFQFDRESGHKILKSFAGGTDGMLPFGGVTRDAGGVLYGSTFYGGNMSCGSIGCGTLFKIAPSGAFTQLHVFGAGGAGTDGYGPNATLYRVKDRLYGTTVYWGPGPAGSPFSIQTNGAGFGTITPTGPAYNFMAGLTEDQSGNLWGVAMRAGSAGLGGIYRITAGVFALVYTFSGPDGAYPTGTLVYDEGSGLLYGTTKGNGTWSGEGSGPGGFGTVFSFNPATNALTTLHTFTGPDGKNPFSGLVRDPSGALYGVAPYGGRSDKGVIFMVHP